MPLGAHVLVEAWGRIPGPLRARGDRSVVRDHHHRQSRRMALGEQIEDAATRVDVEVARRLISEEQPRLVDEGSSECNALLFTAAALWARGYEMTGFWSSGHVGWLPWPAWVFPFALFRLFDILKPWIIGRADRRHGG